MTFARPWVLGFLVLAPLIFLALTMEARSRRKRLLAFAQEELLERLTGRHSPGRAFLKALSLVLGLSFCVVALAGPRWGSHYEEVRHKGVDIVVAVDVSPSMLARDVQPSRLECAKREVYDLLRVLQGDRLGLVAFSGTAFVECPLTLDYAAIEMFLAELDPGLIPVPGTDLGAALEVALNAFDFTSRTDKVIILVTDGEDNEGRGIEAAQKAAEKGVKAYVYGIGSAQGAPVPDGQGGGFMKDASGGMVMSKLDEKGLQAVAQATGGRYVGSVTGDLDLDLLYFAGIKASTTARELGSKKVQVFEERFQVPAVLAFLLLLLEGALSVRTLRKEGA
ncbi:MAG TPA: VWA domain-containing protein [Deltaproteobacteria bacterium]|jgi:Ca-activated chloride channel family protein|nr:VWA domain-containing protein [Deltaproteobacteria bacterium]HOI05998.1 VWA domain-containing protein [Deltaproteobacteria bacterium]